MTAPTPCLGCGHSTTGGAFADDVCGPCWNGADGSRGKDRWERLRAARALSAPALDPETLAAVERLESDVRHVEKPPAGDFVRVALPDARLLLRALGRGR